MAFQVADDLCDMDQDGDHSLNIGIFLGKEKAYSFFEKEINLFTQKLIKLEMMTPEFLQIIDFLVYQAKIGS